MERLETKRLWIEAWNVSRRDDFAGLAKDPKVMEFIGDGTPWSDDRISDVFSSMLRHWETHGFGWRAAIEKQSRAFIGFVGLNYLSPDAVDVEDKDQVEIGWWIAPTHWHQRLATEGALALRDEAFERMDLDHIIARCDARNEASARIMKTIGMVFDREALGRFGNSVLAYSLTKDHWSNLPRSGA